MKIKHLKGGVQMNFVLLLEIKGNIALVYDPEIKSEINVSLSPEEVQYYQDMLTENPEEEVIVFYDSSEKSLKTISHEKELG